MFLEGHGWEVSKLTFDATGNRLLSFGWDMTLRLWNVPARRLALTRRRRGLDATRLESAGRFGLLPGV